MPPASICGPGRLLPLVVLTCLLAGCVADEPLPAAPAESPATDAEPITETRTLEVAGELGQGAFVCAAGNCLGTPELRAADNVHFLELANGTFDGGNVTITWQAESALTATLQTFIGFTDPCEEDSCPWSPVARVQGQSPLVVPLGPDLVANGTLADGQSLAIVVASTTNVEGLPVAVLAKGGQAFMLQADVTLTRLF